jgi:hypothetical protein
MLKQLKNEVWKPYVVKGSEKLPRKYMVSSLGRVAYYLKSFNTDAELLPIADANGVPKVTLKLRTKSIRVMVHRMVAQAFHKPANKQQKSVIHLNHNKADNRASNLQWATAKEVTQHNYNNPNMQEAYKKMAQRFIDAKKGKKLKLSEVIQIKKILANPNRKLSYPQIAEKFGVSERAISRIKSGENWAGVTI